MPPVRIDVRLGQKQTCAAQTAISALPSIADIDWCQLNVR